jgi:hypothetical protein
MFPTLGGRSPVGLDLPFHAGRDIPPALPRKIAADIHLTVDDFLGAR